MPRRRGGRLTEDEELLLAIRRSEAEANQRCKLDQDEEEALKRALEESLLEAANAAAADSGLEPSSQGASTEGGGVETEEHGLQSPEKASEAATDGGETRDPKLGRGGKQGGKGKTKRLAARAARKLGRKEPDPQHEPPQDQAGEMLVAGSGEVLDDFASAWEACKADGTKWGGRGRGGRGVARQQAGMSSAVKDVYIDKITLTVGGHELLQESPLRLVHGRRYALLGDNGVGKSSLLHRIAAGTLPGFPPLLVVALVAQEEASAPPNDLSALDWLVSMTSSTRAAALDRELAAAELALDELDVSGGSEAAASQAHEVATRIAEIEEEQEALRF